MNQGGLKNMVVLKNLPSNIVEEAIIVLKTNKKIKQVEKIEKEKITENKDTKTREDDYILKEAEMLVNTYISKLEEKKSMNNNYQKKANRKYKRIKNYAYVISFVALIESLIILMK
jgi:ribosomal protein S19E (S16A)